MSSLIEEQNRLYNTSLNNDREAQNTIIEEKLIQFSDLISQLKEKQSIIDDEKEREESLKSLNELSPRSRRKLFLEKMESCNTLEEEVQESVQPEIENPFFNVTIEESKSIPLENRFVFKISDHLFLFNALELLQSGNVLLDNRNRVECVTIPIELPIANKNTEVEEEDPDFETLKYSIFDPIVLQIFEDAAGITPPEKVYKSDQNIQMSTRYNEEDFLLDDDDVEEMSISDEIERDVENTDYNENVKELTESVFSRLSMLGIFYQREESQNIVESLIANNLDCGYSKETIIENVVATFI